MSHAISEKMKEGLASEVFPGAVLLIASREKVHFHEAFGFAQIRPVQTRMDCDTLFDLASLTKPIATATAIALLQKADLLCLKDFLAKYLPLFSGGKKAEVRLFHLLNHSSGLPAWRPYYKTVTQREKVEKGFLGSSEAKKLVYQMASQEALIAAPGEKTLYSDVGFILLAAVVERISGMTLDQFCDAQFFSKLGPEAPFFIPTGGSFPEKADQRFAATEDVGWRNGVICGRVHDDNAYAMGGVAGHAGLFSTTFGLLRAVRAWLESIQGAGILDPEIATQYVNRQAGDKFPKGASWGLGWDTPSRPSSSGRFFSPQSFGHLGFTGTSIWVDIENDLIVLLLSNRVHPSSGNEQIRRFRPALHDIIFQELVGGA